MPSSTSASGLSPVVRPGSERWGFTLVELLTVMAIIGILMAILVPSLGMAQKSARKAKSMSNLRNIGGAFGLYANDNSGLLPAPLFGQSGVTGNVVGSANPRGGTWLEELIYPYLEGQIQPSSDGSKIVVIQWPEALTDPEYLIDHDNYISESDQDKRGYGMNIYPYRADRSTANADARTQDCSTARQKLGQLPNLANNIIIGTSDGTTLEPGPDGTFPPAGNNEYPVGNPVRFNGAGLYLFMDWSVQSLQPAEVAKILSTSSINP
jgi:prepilin-type N-terminal cleavage/methylation domain-containing protein